HPDDDVLVLFLTSHGSPDGLEVENGSLPLSQLAPADLREALDDAEIRWRVVVVSACYAGVFLDELKSDTTAIITAADATHTSFGCEDNRELTWFGEAFLKDSLARSLSRPAVRRDPGGGRGQAHAIAAPQGTAAARRPAAAEARDRHGAHARAGRHPGGLRTWGRAGARGTQGRAGLLDAAGRALG